MCGLLGWQWKSGRYPSKKQRQTLARLLAEGNDSRGGQSWGIWSPDLTLRGMGKLGPHTHRFASLPSVFGHSRWATHGTNTIENTHPFVGGGLAVAHNGVISNHDELNTANGRTCVVDSEHILKHMQEGKPFTDFKAYGAIVWAQENSPGCIFMGRLSSRGQLCVVETAHGIIWTSDSSHMAKALKAAGIKQEGGDYKVPAGKAFYVENGEFFESPSTPSILVSEPVTYTHYSQYTTGVNYSEFTYWCNKHKDNYTKCPCSSKDAWVIEVRRSKQPEAGKTAEPEPHPCVWWNCMAPRVGPSYCEAHATPEQRKAGHGDGKKADYFCSEANCFTPSATGSEKCYRHTPALTGTDRLQRDGYRQCPETEADGKKCQVWSQAPRCFAHSQRTCVREGCNLVLTSKEVFHCPRHANTTPPLPLSVRPTAPAPLPLTQVAPPAVTVSGTPAQQMRAEWAVQMNPDDPEGFSRLKKQMQCEMASWWLETEKGHVPDVTNGMNAQAVLDLAIEEGFDPEAAIAGMFEDPEAYNVS